MPFNIGPGELIIVLIIALIVVGPGKLPDVGASLGKSIREFRKAASDVKESTSLDAPAPAPAAIAPAAAAAPLSAASVAVAAPPAPSVAAPPAPSAGEPPAPAPSVDELPDPDAVKPAAGAAVASDEQPTPTA
jgi:TatA/E family protein of Tat protein translocase